MIDRVERAVSRAVERELGRPVTRWGRLVEREWSWQMSLHIAGPSGGELLLKIPRWEEAPTLAAALEAGEQEATRREFAGLRRIEAAVLASGDPGLTAVAPVAYVPEVNGILMHRLDGEPLLRRIGLGGRRPSDAALFARIGRWIRVFHSIDGGPGRRRFSATDEIERSRLLEERLRGRGRLPVGLARAMSSLRTSAERFDGVEEPEAEIHGDLNASNVVVARDDRIAVIDPNREQGPALEDAARILVDVRLTGRQLMTAGLFRPRRLLDDWQARVVEGAGYGAEPLLDYRLARRAVERWAEIEEELGGVRRLALPVARFLLRREVRTRIERIA